MNVLRAIGCCAVGWGLVMHQGWALDPPTLWVRVSNPVSYFEVSGIDLQIRRGGAGISHVQSSVRLLSKHSRALSAAAPYVRSFQIPCTPDPNASHWIEASSAAGFIHTKNREYRGALRLDLRTCSVVHSVDIEKYLVGLLQVEFNSRWPTSSIDAQVIAARSYAYSAYLKDPEALRGYHLESDERDQMYLGSGVEDVEGERSIHRTYGKILLDPDSGKPLKAFYHACCGGVSRLPQEVWGTQVSGYRKKSQCGGCQKAPSYRWQVVLQNMDFSYFPGFERAQGFLNGVRIWQFGGPQWSQVKDFSKAKFREIFRSKGVKSENFEIRKLDAQRYVVEGKGYGHGVGMCQWGAKQAGERGFSTDSILSAYYPDARLKRAW